MSPEPLIQLQQVAEHLLEPSLVSVGQTEHHHIPSVHRLRPPLEVRIDRLTVRMLLVANEDKPVLHVGPAMDRTEHDIRQADGIVCPDEEEFGRVTPLPELAPERRSLKPG